MPLLIGGGLLLGGALAGGVGAWMGGEQQKQAAETSLGRYDTAYGMLSDNLPTGLSATASGYNPNQQFLSPLQERVMSSAWADAANPRMAGLSGQQLAGMSQYGRQANTAFGQAAPVGMFQAPSFDVAGAAQREYGLLESLLRPGQQRAQNALEENLLARGMLGSTGGATQLGALSEAQGQQNRAAAQQAIGSARESQAQQYGQAMGAFQANLGRQQQMFGQGMSALGAQQNLAELQRSLASPERRQALQSQAAQLGMSLGQYEQGLKAQAYSQAMGAQGMLNQMQQARAGVYAGGADYAGMAAMDPFAMAMGGMLSGAGQGAGALGGAVLSNPSLYGGSGGGMFSQATQPGQYGPMAYGYQWG